MRSTLIAVGLDAEKLIRSVGYFGLLAVVFAESGIMLGFFLPGDSLLFIAGFLSYRGEVMPDIVWVSLGCFVAAVAGDQVGYVTGRRVGPALFQRPNSRLFRQEYVDKAEGFFERHGSKTIVMARFVPIVRTFAPIVAGVSKMHYRTFVVFNVIGGFLWAVGITQAGYWLGRTFPWLGEEIDKVVILIVVVSVLPMGIEVLRHRRRARREAAAAVEDTAA
ncbi:MAG: VTT domain-containing protein [Acidimicrobiales bacterium]|jgi:membrane-associated protein|nr:VTT domain-containing protein [Acidimicrobiales bacterium]